MAEGSPKLVLTWTVENWITVVLMVAIGYALIGGVVALVKANLPGMQASSET